MRKLKFPSSSLCVGSLLERHPLSGTIASSQSAETPPYSTMTPTQLEARSTSDLPSLPRQLPPHLEASMFGHLIPSCMHAAWYMYM